MTDLLTDAERLFPPKPGGMVDTARKRMQAESDQLDALAAQPEPPGVNHAIPVMQRGAELARARTFTVATGANPVVQLLGQDVNRRSVVVLAMDKPAVISFSLQAADDPVNPVNAAGLPANGFVLPQGVPVTFPAQGVIYCTALSSTPTRVSVAAFSYSEG